MKYSILSILIAVCLGACSLGKQELQTSNEELRLELKTTHSELENKEQELQQAYKTIERLKNEIITRQTPVQKTSPATSAKVEAIKANKKENHSETLRCKATTKAGKQCSRNAETESSYCWQHQKKKITPTPAAASSLNGQTIYTGSRGGQYYINKNGKKTYIKR